jgi:hypothetical protein
MFRGLPLSPRSVYKVNQSHLFWGVLVAPFGWYPSQINNPTRRSVLLILTQKLVSEMYRSDGRFEEEHRPSVSVYRKYLLTNFSSSEKKHKMRTPFINLYVLLSSSCTHCPLFLLY